MCNIQAKDVANVRTDALLMKLGIIDLEHVIREGRLRWYGHVMRSAGPARTALDLEVAGRRGPGGPKMTWIRVIERDRQLWGLTTTDPLDRDGWRNRTKTAMRGATQTGLGAH